MKNNVAHRRGTKRKPRARAGVAATHGRQAPIVRPQEFPLYCDFSCPKADFPPADAVGACRREQAVWCGVLKEFNTKNGRCKVKFDMRS